MSARPARRRRIGLSIALAFAAATLLATTAEARRPKRKGETYIFTLFKVELVPGIPAEIEKQVKAQLLEQIEEHKALHSEIPKAAPDPKKEPRKFERYLKRRRQRAFKVNVEVTDYETELEPIEGSSSKMLVVRVSLRLFGETIPKRVMAFAGDGSATIKVEVGRKVRDRDREYANDEALKLAVSDAIKISIKKLRAGPPKRKRRRKK